MSKWDRSFYHYQMPTVEIIYCGTVWLVVFRLPEYLYICSIVYMEYSICGYLRCMPLWLTAASCFVHHFIIVQYIFVRFMYVNGSSIANVGEKSMSGWDGAFYHYQMLYRYQLWRYVWKDQKIEFELWILRYLEMSSCRCFNPFF
jgi:hypothetical protein